MAFMVGISFDPVGIPQAESQHLSISREPNELYSAESLHEAVFKKCIYALRRFISSYVDICIFFWVDSLLIATAIEFLYAIYDCSRDIVKYSRQICSVILKKVKYFL